jgi:hypothetical protein
MTPDGVEEESIFSTDSNGQVFPVLVSDTHGIAVVKALWAGDSSVPAAVAYAPHHILYDSEVGDPAKKFQFFVEGVEYPYASGHYSLGSVTDPQQFEVVLPEWASTITKRGLVSIFRKGVKEYSGVLNKFQRVFGENPQQTLTGTDAKSMLETRDVTLKDYSEKTLAYIVEDLLDSYPCGISVGALGDFPAPLTITFADESLVSSISRLCNLIGWRYRVTDENKLDILPFFGEVKAQITFTEGQNLFLANNAEDYTQVANNIRARGAQTLVSTQFNQASIEALGILDDVLFQKSIADQNTLDLAAAVEVAKRSAIATTIEAEVLDNYDVGSWGVDDCVTLTCNDVELSGMYRILKIERDMTDPNWGLVTFANLPQVSITDILGSLKRQVKDLGAKTAI